MPALLTRLLAALRSLYIFDRPGSRVRLAPRQKLPLAALPLLALWYLARPAPVTAAALAALGGLLLAAYLWARSLALGVEARRRLRYAALQVGDELEEQVTLSNSSLLPLVWAELVDQSNLPNYPFSSVRSTGGRSHIEWRTHTTCARRGVFTLGPWAMRCGDPFGLFLVSHTYLQQNEILVYPPLAPLPGRLLPRGQVLGEERPLVQPLPAETQDAFTARPYQPGDPLRHIHWPISARQGAPYVKVFEPEDASSVWLLADLDAAALQGAEEEPDSSLETMILLLASLASALLQQRAAVGLLAYSGIGPAGEPQVSLPSRNPLHLWDLLRMLARLEPAPHPFQETLEKAAALVGGRDQVVAVTPSLSAAWLPALHQLNRGRRRQGASVILIDPAEARGVLRDPANARGMLRDTVSQPAAAAAGGEPQARTSTADLFAGLLARQGIHASVVRRGELRPIRGAYGELSRWEFQTLGTGRVVVRHAPRPLGARPGGPA